MRLPESSREKESGESQDVSASWGIWVRNIFFRRSESEGRGNSPLDFWMKMSVLCFNAFLDVPHSKNRAVENERGILAVYFITMCFILIK